MSRGARDLDLTKAVRSRSVIRVRNGWYSTLDESDPRVHAVRVGGRLTGISAVAAMAGWVLHRHPLHVSLPYNSARMRRPTDRRRPLHPPVSDVALHWDSLECQLRGDSTTVALRDALVRVVIDENRETSIAALDWALHSGLIKMFDVELIMLAVPALRRFANQWLDPWCESLPESLSRTRLRQQGHTVVSQVMLDTGELVDLVVDGVVGLEVDGDEFHREHFERDRRKDAQIMLEKLIPFRPSARMVFYDWPLVLAAVQTAIATRATPVSFGNSGTRTRSTRSKRLRGARAHSVPEFSTEQRRE